MLFITDIYPPYSLSCWNLNITSQKICCCLSWSTVYTGRWRHSALLVASRERGGVSVNKCQTFHFTLNAAYYLEVYFNSWKNPHGSLKWNVSFITALFLILYSNIQTPPPFAPIYLWFNYIVYNKIRPLSWETKYFTQFLTV